MMQQDLRKAPEKRLISYPKALSASRQDIYTVPTDFSSRLVSVVAVNTHASTARALTVELYDSETSTYFNIAAGESLAAKTRTIIEAKDGPLISLEGGDKVAANQDTGTDVHVIVTIEELGARGV